MAELDRRVVVRFTRPGQIPDAFPNGYILPRDATYDPTVWTITDEEDRTKTYGPWATASDKTMFFDNRGAVTVLRIGRDDYDIPGSANRIPRGWPVALHWVQAGTPDVDHGTTVYYAGTKIGDVNGNMGVYFTTNPNDEDTRVTLGYDSGRPLNTVPIRSITVTPYFVADRHGQSVEWARSIQEGVGADTLSIGAAGTVQARVVYRTFIVRYWRYATDNLLSVTDADGTVWQITGWESVGRDRFTQLSCSRTLPVSSM